MNVQSNRALARSLDLAVLSETPEFNHVLRTLATRAMSEAQYFCTGDHEPDDFYHYGLAAEYYTHFTSPIRRYADVVAHRLLMQSLEVR
jgi:exoribonuclease R